MKNLNNAVVCLTISIFCASNFVVGAVPDEIKKELEKIKGPKITEQISTLKTLIFLENLTNEMYSTEETFNRQLKALIPLEEKLKNQKPVTAGFFTGKTRREEINKENALLEKQSKMFSDEIKNLEKIVKLSSNLKILFSALKENFSPPLDNLSKSDLDLLKRGLIDLDLDFDKDKYVDSIIVLKDISKRLIDDETISVFQKAVSVDFNEKLENPRSIKITDDDTGLTFQSLRITPVQRPPRYILLFKEFVKNLEKLPGLLPDDGIKNVLDSARATLASAESLAAQVNAAAFVQKPLAK